MAEPSSPDPGDLPDFSALRRELRASRSHGLLLSGSELAALEAMFAHPDHPDAGELRDSLAFSMGVRLSHELFPGLTELYVNFGMAERIDSELKERVESHVQEGLGAALAQLCRELTGARQDRTGQRPRATALARGRDTAGAG